MSSRRFRVSKTNRSVALSLALASLAAMGSAVLSGRVPRLGSIAIGDDRLVAWEALPEMNGPMCEYLPASMTLAAPQQAGSARPASGTTAPPHPSAQVRAQVAAR